ncbi:MAG: flavodoxin reductase, partial [Gemmatimonadota bacterium]
TPADVICERELRHLLRERCVLTCTDRGGEGFEHRKIDSDFLRDHVDQVDGTFYVCGPPSFVTDVSAALLEMGANEETIVVEE